MKDLFKGKDGRLHVNRTGCVHWTKDNVNTYLAVDVLHAYMRDSVVVTKADCKPPRVHCPL